jgi:protein SCO1
MNDQTPGDELSEEARRAAFREELRLTPETGGGRIVGRIPRKVLWGGVAVLAVLGIGGQLVEHYFGNIGLPSTSGPTTTFTTPTTLPGLTTTTIANAARADAAYIGLKPIANALAPRFTLTDQSGHPYGPAQAAGRLTLITFFNKNCNDICPVEGAEVRELLADLGPRARRVNVIVVNTDPFSFAVNVRPLALAETGLSPMPQVHFVTGPLASLNAVWRAYGVQVDVGASAQQVSHNAVIYLVSPDSHLTAIVTPFAHRSAAGVFSLPAADVTHFARGLDLETVSLVK